MNAATRWEIMSCQEQSVDRLASALTLPPLVARLLCQRGLDDPESAARFLKPSIDQLHDPMALTDMEVAVPRVLAAIARKERIAVHGDYDVDGITSTVAPSSSSAPTLSISFPSGSRTAMVSSPPR